MKKDYSLLHYLISQPAIDHPEPHPVANVTIQSIATKKINHTDSTANSFFDINIYNLYIV